VRGGLRGNDQAGKLDRRDLNRRPDVLQGLVVEPQPRPPTTSERQACAAALKHASIAERELLQAELRVGEAGIAISDEVLDVVDDLVNDLMLLAAGERMLSPPESDLPYSFADRVCAEWRQRRVRARRRAA
jgi:hypothetical protein